MSEISERIKKIRTDADLTQQEFADKLGVSRTNIGGYEAGTREPSKSAENNICSVFNVRKEWLATGEGKIYLSESMTTKIEDFVKSTVSEPDGFKARLINVLSSLSESDWEVLERMADKMKNG